VEAVLTGFVYKRMKIHVVVEMQSNMFQQGQVAVFFCPMGIAPGGITHQEITLLPHVLMQAGHTTTGIVDIPFVHPLGAMDVADAATERGQLGSVGIMVFNALLTGASAPVEAETVTLAVSVSFSEMDLSVPDPLLTPIPVVPRAVPQRNRIVVQMMRDPPEEPEIVKHVCDHCMRIHDCHSEGECDDRVQIRVADRIFVLFFCCDDCWFAFWGDGLLEWQYVLETEGRFHAEGLAILQGSSNDGAL